MKNKKNKKKLKKFVEGGETILTPKPRAIGTGEKKDSYTEYNPSKDAEKQWILNWMGDPEFNKRLLNNVETYEDKHIKGKGKKFAGFNNEKRAETFTNNALERLKTVKQVEYPSYAAFREEAGSPNSKAFYQPGDHTIHYPSPNLSYQQPEDKQAIKSSKVHELIHASQLDQLQKIVPAPEILNNVRKELEIELGYKFKQGYDGTLQIESSGSFNAEKFKKARAIVEKYGLTPNLDVDINSYNSSNPKDMEKYKRIMDTQYLNYLNGDQEAYPRIMSLRYKYDIKPGQIVDDKLFEQMLKDHKSGVNENMLFNYYSKEQIKRMFNELADNKGSSKDPNTNLQYAKYGGSLKKYGLGGPGDPTTIARKDVMSVNGAVTQTAGNTGALVVDPYNFAFEAGVTTLTPQQWNLLSAMQKQAIQHQAYSKVGLKQTGDNTFTGTQGQANMFKKGGKLPKYANGGDPPTDDGKKGIKYVSDPNDPALKAYNDSLSLYNGYIKERNGPYMDADYYESQDWVKNLYYPKGTKDYKRVIDYTKESWGAKYHSSIKPIGIYEPGEYPLTGMPVYKKPVQPVKLATKMGDKDHQREVGWTGVTTKVGWIGERPEGKLKEPIKKGAQYPRFSLPSAIQGEGMRDIYEYNPKTGNYLPTSTMPLDDVKNMDIINKATTESMRKDIERFLPTNNQKSKFNEGGTIGASIGQGLGMLTSLIPGVGPLISPLATKAFTDAGQYFGDSMYDKKHPEQNTQDAMNLKNFTTNPYGDYKYGGKTPNSLRATHGGKLAGLGADVYLAKGRPHSKGGIKGDTNGDGKAEIEFEGGELYFDKEQYIVNKDISKKYANSLKRLAERSDSVSKSSLAMLKNKIINENESMRMENTPKTKFIGGGGLYLGGLPGATQNLSSVPLQSYFYNNPSSVSTPSTKIEDSSAVGFTGNPFNTNSTKTGSLYNTAGLIGQAIPAAYNIGMGLFNKPEVVKPFANPYTNEIKSNLGKMGYNGQSVQNQLNRTFAAGKDTMLNFSGNSGVTMSNMQNLYSNLGQKKAEADLMGQTMNNNILSTKNQTLASLGAQNMQGKILAKQMTDANKATKNAFLSTGIGQVGQLGSSIMTIGNTEAENDIKLKALQNAFSTYTVDANVINQIRAGKVPPGWTEQDIILFKQLDASLNKSGN